MKSEDVDQDKLARRIADELNEKLHAEASRLAEINLVFLKVIQEGRFFAGQFEDFLSNHNMHELFGQSNMLEAWIAMADHIITELTEGARHPNDHESD